jgi:hypothetical protein
MSTTQLENQAQFVVDANGNTTLVVLDIRTWRQLIETLNKMSTDANSPVISTTSTKKDDPLARLIGIADVEPFADKVDELLYGT